ncbi:MAG: hypothetical protein U0Q19_22415 [Kineosporiaceae bacterium]
MTAGVTPRTPPGRAGVLLDLDDTLVDTRMPRACRRAIVAGWLPHLDAAGEAAALQHWVRDAEGHFRAYTRGELSFAEQRQRRAAALQAAFDGPALSADEQRRWSEAYDAAFREAWRLSRTPCRCWSASTAGAALRAGDQCRGRSISATSCDGSVWPIGSR